MSAEGFLILSPAAMCHDIKTYKDTKQEGEEIHKENNENEGKHYRIQIKDPGSVGKQQHEKGRTKRKTNISSK